MSADAAAARRHRAPTEAESGVGESRDEKPHATRGRSAGLSSRKETRGGLKGTGVPPADEVGVPAAAGGESASRCGVSLPAAGGSELEWKRFVKLASARLASTSTLRSFCSESGTVWPAAEIEPCIRPVSRLEEAGSEPRVAEPRVARDRVFGRGGRVLHSENGCH